MSLLKQSALVTLAVFPMLGFATKCPEFLQNMANQYLSNHAVTENITSVSLAVSLSDGTPLQTCYAGRVSNQPYAPVATDNNLYQVGSITKSFVSVLILQLEAQGKLNINDPIGKYLPQYPKWSTVTIKQLLNMTSGIPSYTTPGVAPAFFDAYQQNSSPAPAWTPEQLVSFAYHAPCQADQGCFAPGTSYSYSNTNYILAGMVVTAMTGQPLEYELHQFFMDHQLPNTFYLPYSYSNLPKTYERYNIPARMVHGYWNISGANIPLPYAIGSDMTNVNLSYGSAAGAITSNMQDINTWVRLLFSSDFLAQAQQQELKTVVCEDANSQCQLGQPIQVNAQNPDGYGLGINESYDSQLGNYWNYEGATWGYRFIWIKVKKSNLVVIATVNSDSVADDLTPFVLQVAQAN